MRPNFKELKHVFEVTQSKVKNKRLQKLLHNLTVIRKNKKIGTTNNKRSKQCGDTFKGKKMSSSNSRHMCLIVVLQLPLNKSQSF